MHAIDPDFVFPPFEVWAVNLGTMMAHHTPGEYRCQFEGAVEQRLTLVRTPFDELEKRNPRGNMRERILHKRLMLSCPTRDKTCSYVSRFSSGMDERFHRDVLTEPPTFEGIVSRCGRHGADEILQAARSSTGIC